MVFKKTKRKSMEFLSKVLKHQQMLILATLTYCLKIKFLFKKKKKKRKKDWFRGRNISVEGGGILGPSSLSGTCFRWESHPAEVRGGGKRENPEEKLGRKP
jgi:hypothetical protein